MDGGNLKDIVIGGGCGGGDDGEAPNLFVTPCDSGDIYYHHNIDTTPIHLDMPLFEEIVDHLPTDSEDEDTEPILITLTEDVVSEEVCSPEPSLELLEKMRAAARCKTSILLHHTQIPSKVPQSEKLKHVETEDEPPGGINTNTACCLNTGGKKRVNERAYIHEHDYHVKPSVAQTRTIPAFGEQSETFGTLKSVPPVAKVEPRNEMNMGGDAPNSLSNMIHTRREKKKRGRTISQGSVGTTTSGCSDSNCSQTHSDSNESDSESSSGSESSSSSSSSSNSSESSDDEGGDGCGGRAGRRRTWRRPHQSVSRMTPNKENTSIESSGESERWGRHRIEGRHGRVVQESRSRSRSGSKSRRKSRSRSGSKSRRKSRSRSRSTGRRKSRSRSTGRRKSRSRSKSRSKSRSESRGVRKTCSKTGQVRGCRKRLRSGSDEDSLDHNRNRKRLRRGGGARAKEELFVKKQDAMSSRRILYVGDLKASTGKSVLWRRFQRFGPIEAITMHSRADGTHYGFVTFSNARDAFQAKEKGNDNLLPSETIFDLNFGGRRYFCDEDYQDLDNFGDDEDEYDLDAAAHITPTVQHYTGYGSTFGCKQETEFDSLLRAAQSSIKKN